MKALSSNKIQVSCPCVYDRRDAERFTVKRNCLVLSHNKISYCFFSGQTDIFIVVKHFGKKPDIKEIKSYILNNIVLYYRSGLSDERY